MSTSNARKALMVLAHNNFRDEEYTSARQSLEESGLEVAVTSTVARNAMGSQGMNIDPDLLIDDVSPDDYDAVVFVGGTGASQYWHDIHAHTIATTLNDASKIVGATSHASVTLAVAGLLTGKKATSHVAVYEKLQVAGAKYTGSNVEVDGNIITSSGANAAKEFSQTLSQALR